ncbi:MAG: hypothetical protein AL399_08835 [Candidatus [Bacteroides] periocalifornicus]|uniref:Uncharacterized protein n=1 Tax=Candidatus [Bacteroides] periocalifornicus TaxID=1702214 RepID=A0A0Q4B581_9BACT|nr:MAG: hypothetical protein AL399_08835 [Candidatus [Bacteroides] periocalifornicus]
MIGGQCRNRIAMRPSKRDAARRVVLYVMRRGIVRASTLATFCIAPTKRRWAIAPIDRKVISYHDAARRVATVFEKWNCKIRTDLPEEPYKD